MVDYEQWILLNVMEPAGLCFYYTGYLAASFSELLRVAGTYTEPSGEMRHGHYWCRTQDGIIVDPTAGQFEPGGRYEESVVVPLLYEDLVDLIELPLFESLEPWVQMRCKLWLGVIENGRTDARPGAAKSFEVAAEIGT